MDQPTADDAPEARPIGAFLMEQRSGDLALEMSTKLQEIVNAVQAHQKGGSLTLEIKVAPTKMEGALFVTDKLKWNIPEAERGGSFMFSDAKGNLMRRNPNQLTFDDASPLRAVPDTDGDIVSVPTADGTVVHVDPGTGEVH